MRITPLQDLLLRKVLPLADVMQATGRSRVQVWRWAKGASHPRDAVTRERLIEFYRERGHALDYNGCYQPSIELTEDQARNYGLS
jgi:hypothetical protein